MKIITDLQIHSKYARAVSPEMVVPKIWEWAKRKGIGLIATGDWTHPLWMREIKKDLEETGTGLLKLKNQDSGPLFLLETEVSCIYSQGGRLRRVHTMIWAPSLDSAEKINKKLMSLGANLMSDGRPIMGLTSIQIAEVVLSIDPKALIVPAHIWTPWFSLYGSESGFDSIAECFGEYAKYIYAIETGLSSNPEMNWRVKDLDTRSIVSFSDAHSGPKLGREATVFELENLSFEAIRQALILPNKTKNRVAYTMEFYPEEGKYHYTGHRNCQIKQTPEETRAKGTLCPVCGKKLTGGVLYRVDQLAGRSEADLGMEKTTMEGILTTMYRSKMISDRPPYLMMVPLAEIISEVNGGSPTTKGVLNEYFKLVEHFGSEFKVLTEVEAENLSKISGEKLAQAIDKVRKGDIFVDPGYDGVFGKVKIWADEKKDTESVNKKQMSLF
ncbi:MAG: UvrD/REP helicase [Candidatus Gottesmanbacteria bacterium GW2011_GWA2_43_14]|uniref:UvrD/REP helicase n=1 Tax=Candidatus Gottesmanbacteria bacterium GW2011_GWA2_43_14 TaxID=1618443 RepID=A0A0G1GGN1_9BACT|nr:MAG: UvrD/REP helicase [Candidatus Gottesmanbacteria bacterium GW2011_GWA2_43_14]